MNSKIWEINGLSLSIDLDNADDVERYESAFALMADEEMKVPREGKSSEIIRAYCKLFTNLFDRIFGDGTSDKIFKDVPTSTAAYDEVYASFLDYVRKQSVAIAQARAEWRTKYLPARRQSKK